MGNLAWSQKILAKFDPSFQPRWEVYNKVIKNSLNSEKVWIDCGCGKNETVEIFGILAKQATGVDITKEVEFKKNFIKADIRKLPFPSGYADLASLRFVVEHFKNPDEYLSELKRVLKTGGRIVIITTNLLSPFIFLPKIILPYPLKQKILTKLFKVKDDDVFPTYHRLNSPAKFYNLKNDFTVREMLFISDLNSTRKWLFFILLFWHKLTEITTLNKFRTNILVILEKK
jgi:ubiquinone/menaquinone biosynthesis C-methylase UbiE